MLFGGFGINLFTVQATLVLTITVWRTNLQLQVGANFIAAQTNSAVLCLTGVLYIRSFSVAGWLGRTFFAFTHSVKIRLLVDKSAVVAFSHIK